MRSIDAHPPESPGPSPLERLVIAEILLIELMIAIALIAVVVSILRPAIRPATTSGIARPSHACRIAANLISRPREIVNCAG